MAEFDGPAEAKKLLAVAQGSSVDDLMRIEPAMAHRCKADVVPRNSMHVSLR